MTPRRLEHFLVPQPLCNMPHFLPSHAFSSAAPLGATGATTCLARAAHQASPPRQDGTAHIEKNNSISW